MAFITTNPYGGIPAFAASLVNVPELQGPVSSATGGTNSLATSVSDLLTYIDTTTGVATVNQIGSVTNTTITVKNTLNLSNAATIQYLGADILTSNAVNGTTSYLTLGVNSVEQARLTTTGLGLQTSIPIATLDVNGSAVIRKTLYVSSFGGGTPITPLGDIYADGNVYAHGLLLTSDPALKRDISPYTLRGELPDPVRFTWIATGAEDIGVLATDVALREPLCVQSTPTGTLTVNYPKLVVLLLAEVKALKAEVQALSAKVASNAPTTP